MASTYTVQVCSSLLWLSLAYSFAMLPCESMVPVSNFSASELKQTNFLNYTPPCVASSLLLSFKTGGGEGVLFFSGTQRTPHTSFTKKREKKRGARLHPQPVQTKEEENTTKNPKSGKRERKTKCSILRTNKKRHDCGVR